MIVTGIRPIAARAPIRVGGPVAFGRAGLTFGAEATAYLAAMTVTPSDTRRQQLGALIDGLVADGVWSNLSALFIEAAHDSQAARVNAVNPALVAAAVNSPNFTVDRGYASDGATSYLNFGWDPSTDGGALYQQNSCCQGVWSLGASGSASLMVGSNTARINPRNVSNLMSVVAQAGASATLAISGTPPNGLFAWDRTAAAAYRFMYNGAAQGSTTTASVPLDTRDFYGNAINNAGTPASHDTRRCAASFWGASMSDALHLALYSRLATYLTAIGAI